MELDWQNGFQQIKERGLYLLQSEKWSDCKFLVGAAPNQRILCGHKLILAMSSPVFERMFYGNLPDESDPILIPDVQPDAFQAMLEYIYSDRISISSFDKACELCYVAKKYMLPYVVEQCTHFLWADLSPKNACRAYEFAKLFDEPRLMQSSMSIIAANTRDVLADPSFVDIEISTLMAILDQDRLNITSELELFNALVKYASERALFVENEVMPMTPSSSLDKGSLQQSFDIDNNTSEVVEIKMEPDDSSLVHSRQENSSDTSHLVEDVVVVENDTSTTYEEKNGHNNASSTEISMIASFSCQNNEIDEALIRQAVQKIRFLTLTPQQFAEGPARSKLLKQNEALAILIKISSPTINDCPMPEGFCSSRTSREYYESRSQRDLPSYHRPTPSNGPAVFAPFETFTGNTASVVTTTPQASSNNVSTFQGGSDSDLTTNDTRRSYCVRTLNQQFDYRNTSVTDCGLTFQVDSNIWITGVQVPTQVLCGELMNSAGFSERYTEILYAHIQDIQGSRLTYTHCTSRVRYDSLLEITFDRPVYVYRNLIYKVYVVFNKVGWYPMYTCVPDVVCNRVKFMFNVGNPSESVRDGLIRAIVFSTPQEQSRCVME
ncbi:uncharacterized protein LOC105228322 isoform X1 [Bactrocera dorsalis]|uniref:Uncharacterized protein LOC105228322 isoform X1 n=2 Tax=Bactrocera dorsalis TaxID=27457 RepID=A0A6I9V916_BACDO|nr:uncharacterized protein LOC105228322 isoform X1 [Bactrocera dorsalis]